mmetsp:Transcript_8305/g.30891  ORF Transcript_8305/g.30891 Transcript_8305/m.30891 type:complete len:224 (+) Transcript_8305:574-1245(+)
MHAISTYCTAESSHLRPHVTAQLNGYSQWSLSLAKRAHRISYQLDAHISRSHTISRIICWTNFDDVSRNLEAGRENTATSTRIDKKQIKMLPSSAQIKPSAYFNKQIERLKLFGPAGIVAYGLLNSCYYTFAMIYCLQTLGGFQSWRHLLKITAVVWTGSQITKILRVWLAILLSPPISTALSYVSNKYSMSRTKVTSLAIAAILISSSLCFMFYIFIHLLIK